MKILVDSSVWSLAFQRNKGQNEEIVRELQELIKEFRVILIGPVRQEILSGISDLKVFQNIKKKLEAFEDIEITTKHYEFAAELYNICRKKGIQGSHTDFLICSVSILNNYSIFTIDKDFNNYEKFSNIKIYTIRKN